MIKSSSEHPPFHTSPGFYVIIILVFILALTWLCCHYGGNLLCISRKEEIGQRLDMVEFASFSNLDEQFPERKIPTPSTAQTLQKHQREGLVGAVTTDSRLYTCNKLTPDSRESMYPNDGDEFESDASSELYGGAQSPGAHQLGEKRFPDIARSRGLSALENSRDIQQFQSVEVRFAESSAVLSEPGSVTRRAPEENLVNFMEAVRRAPEGVKQDDIDSEELKVRRVPEEHLESPVIAFARLSRERRVSSDSKSSYREFDEPAERVVKPPTPGRLPKRSIVKRSSLSEHHKAKFIAGKETKRFPKRRVV